MLGKKKKSLTSFAKGQNSYSVQREATAAKGNDTTDDSDLVIVIIHKFHVISLSAFPF